MAEPTLVNGQITDAVTQTNVDVLASAPTQALASLYQATAHSLGLAMQNAVSQQQSMSTLSQAVTATAANILLGTPAKK